MDKVNILVVDDLPDRLLAFQTILEELAENLVLANSGEEALRRLLERDFAVVLLDVNMPGLNGFETAEMLRRRKKSAHTPIIFLTAFADDVHTARGYSLGAVDYIQTPVVPEILRSKVKVFVDLFRMTERVKRQAEEHVVLAREQAARAAAEETTRRFSFLADASRTLAASLDPETTLRSVVRLAIPFLADLAGITLEGSIQTRLWDEVAWQSSSARDVCTATGSSFVASAELMRDAVTRVLESGQMEVLRDIDVALPESPQTDKTADRLKTALILPLRARGRTLGALTLARGPSRPSYGADDVAVAEDLAGRAAISLDNAKLYQNIQEGDRRKSEFLSMLAHELRNPLAPVRNGVEIMKLLDLANPELIRIRDIIDRQSTHMARLIDDLLDVSRLTRGKILLRKELVDLSGLVRSTLEDYRNTMVASGLKLSVHLPDQPVWTWGDPTRLAQVLGNVLHNASKFTDPGGEVAVSLESRGSASGVLIVRDTGIGMDSAMLERVFETFSQADNTLDRSKGGLGLGLALVHGLVQLHGGQVRVISPGRGRGTEVRIALPLEDPGERVTGASASPGPAAPVRVLLIEDNRDAAESLRTLLTLKGHRVQVVHAGTAGLQAARAARPDIILCDLGMPGELDGYGVASRIRQDPDLRDVCLVAVTGYGQVEDQRRTKDAGFDAHLIKPVDLNRLTEILATLAVRN